MATKKKTAPTTGSEPTSMRATSRAAQSPVPRIGLALSGGGFRAALFHLGTIRCLEERGIMQRVEVMSTVSGGSILGAYYLVEMERKLRCAPERSRLEVCDEIIEGFCGKLTLNFRMRALVFYPFYHPIMTVASLLRLAHRGDTMAKAFERKLFAPTLRIGDLPVQVVDRSGMNMRRTRMLINATSMITGRRVVYSRENETGVSAQIEKSDPNDIVLARVVGASAAVPGLFKPLKVGGDILADGGVIDNQGIESLLDYFEWTDESLNLLERAYRQPTCMRQNESSEIYLIVSDGAGQFSIKSDNKATRAGSAARSMSVLQAANRRKTLKILLEHNDTEEMNGFAFTHLAMNLKGRDDIDDMRLPSEFIMPTAELRTDLDNFSRLERDALIYHGYTLMRAQLKAHCRHLGELCAAPGNFASDEDRPPKSHEPSRPRQHFCWPPPFVDVCHPSCPRSQEARIWISRFLAIGRSSVFRDVRRFPWPILPILIFFILLGTMLSVYLTKTDIPLAGAGRVANWIGNGLNQAAANLIPPINIPYIMNLATLRAGFGSDGAYAPTMLLLSKLLCIALSFYFVLWVFYEVKYRGRLGERAELAKLQSFLCGHDHRVDSE